MVAARCQCPSQGIRLVRPAASHARVLSTSTRGANWMTRPMVEIGTYPTRSEAELAQAALATAGIPSVLESGAAGGASAFDPGEPPRLLVNEADAEAATAVLSDQRAQ